MGYTENGTWKLSASDVPVMETNDSIYIYVQTFEKVGVGANDIEKASYLNNNVLGSAWSNACILKKE